MFREGSVRVYDNRLSEAPSRTPQQSWVESRLDRILQKRRDLARCVTLCHVVSRCVAHCTSIAPASHAKDNVPLIKTDHDVCPSTFGLYNCNHSSKVLGSFLTCCDNAATTLRQLLLIAANGLDRVQTSPGLEMSEETLNYGDKACLKLSMSWYVMIKNLPDDFSYLFQAFKDVIGWVVLVSPKRSQHVSASNSPDSRRPTWTWEYQCAFWILQSILNHHIIQYII